MAGTPAGQVAAAEPGVFAFTVLADDDPVQFGVVGFAQPSAHAGQAVHGTHVRPLVEALADGQPQAPQADVVRHAGPAVRAEVDGVEGPQDVQANRTGVV